MSVPFIGREYELERLKDLLSIRVASLAVVKGRRRIGKSRLVEEFAKNHLFYRFSGIPPTKETSNQDQLNEFSRQMSKQFGGPEIRVDDWSKQFYLLAEKITKRRVVVLFDEISWMGSEDHDFVGKLKNAWDIYFKKNPKLILILCGSVSSWIEKEILLSTAFVGRVDLTLTVDELPLKDCNKFWPQKNNYISAYDKLKMLSITGGVPKYLELIDPTVPAEENIKKLCFYKSGFLVNEFNSLFSDLFSERYGLYKKIITALSNGPLEGKDLAKAIKMTYTGKLLKYLEEMIQSGFISRNHTWHLSTAKISRFNKFRLSDNYARFYLKYIDPAMPSIEINAYKFSSLSSLSNWHTIMGLQCENLLLNNREYIKQCLSISPGTVITDNPFFQKKTARHPGCQIDYLIQIKTNTLYLCEFKFSKEPVKSSVIAEVQKKIDALSYPRGFSVFPVLIHVNGVQDSVIESDYFTKIIDFSKILTSGTNIPKNHPTISQSFYQTHS